ncbi:phage major capsid protein [Anatilimnocola floriformis]|uniref:phage major capsid protein n=1 Tax=Anatilimnocola floriformis TaxID=2948575 RepID=UPI0020C1E94A|nr:phage major capsid protein [Anatilimnocola floriformis]
MKSVAIREQRAKLVHDAREVHERHKAENRDMSADEKSQFEAMMAEVDALKQKVDEIEAGEAGEAAQEEQLAKAEEELKSSQGRKVAADFRSRNNDRSSKDSMDSFRRWLNTGDTRGLVADTDNSGGYLVAPLEFNAMVLKTADELCPIRQLATKRTLGNVKSLGTPTLTKMSAATWTTEVLIGSADSTIATPSRRDLTPYKLVKLVKVTKKLLNIGTVDPENVVAEEFGRTFAETEENAFSTGDGSSKPLGVFYASASGISTGRDVSTDNTSTAFTYDGLINAQASVKGVYRKSKSAAWMFHRDGIAMARKLKDGEGRYCWQPSVQLGEPDTLLGNAVYECGFAPNTFTTGLYVGIFGDFSYYWIADRGTMDVQRLVELYAATGEIGFIAERYLDGAPVIEEAFARVKLA